MQSRTTLRHTILMDSHPSTGCAGVDLVPSCEPQWLSSRHRLYHLHNPKQLVTDDTLSQNLVLLLHYHQIISTLTKTVQYAWDTRTRQTPGRRPHFAA